ncbi:MAG TPA: efflux transporter outer membrane subunit [Candidatus Eisenbacteria bacterium]|nr:efflux transporter outer membrane subunit [Candidatus Eisenbacteria bacterium]
MPVLVAFAPAATGMGFRAPRSRGVETRLVASVLATIVMAGCAVGPNYKRPSIDAPEVTRGQIGPSEAASLADLPWWEVFQDPVLQELVGEAVRQNYDLKTAIARIEQYRQLVGVARADLFPHVGYEGDASRQREFLFPLPNTTFNSFLGEFNLAWEIDIWGRIRRATESAHADYLGAQAFRRGVLLTLVSDVAQAYFELLELDRELEIARLSTDTFRKTLDLFTRQYEGGVGTRLEVSRGAAALAQAAATIPDVERAIVAKENQLSVLLGRNPGPIPRGAPLAAQTTPPDLPVGLPAQLLERRPDILQAEESIVAANANVGVAVGNFFPRLGLSTLYGGQSSEIENIVKGTGNIWAIAGSLAGPIFQGGRLLSSYRSTKAAWEQTVQQYQATVINAFAEVSNSLVSQQKLQGVRGQQERQVAALKDAVNISLERYTQGSSTYFEVLEAQQQLFPAQNALARTTRDQLTVVVLLYRTLGGGWDLDVEQWAPNGTPATAMGGLPS